LRFCTAEGDLPACGHGTVAALAVLADRAGREEYETAVHTAGQVFQGWATRRGGHIEASFATDSIALREPTPAELALILPALGLDPEAPQSGTCVASLGRPRILVPVPSRQALAALAPDLDRLREACDRLGLLGSYAYSVPAADGRAAARMFAPSIGVPEDARPATITAGVRQTPKGPLTHVGGTASIARTLTIPAA
jgi:PhzF family phenazine biosynthesis protein